MSQYIDNEIKNNYAEINKHLKLMQTSCENLNYVNFTSGFKSSALDLIAGYIVQSAITEHMKPSILQSFMEELEIGTELYSYEVYAGYKSRYGSNSYDFGEAITGYWEEYIAAVANVGSNENIIDFAGDTITLIAMIEKQTMLLSCTPQIKGTALQYIDKAVNAMSEIDGDALRDKTYRIAVARAAGDNVLELQDCIDIFEALGDWRESAELRANCVNKVMKLLSKEDIEAAAKIEGYAEPVIKIETKDSKTGLPKEARNTAHITACVSVCIAVLIVLFLVVFGTSRIPYIPDGNAEFLYYGNGKPVSSFGEHCAYIYNDKLIFGYVAYANYEWYHYDEEFEVAGTMCQDKELINIFKMRSIEFKDGTTGRISYNQRTHELKIRYKGKTYLCSDYDI